MKLGQLVITVAVVVVAIVAYDSFRGAEPPASPERAPRLATEPTPENPSSVVLRGSGLTALEARLEGIELRLAALEGGSAVSTAAVGHRGPGGTPNGTVGPEGGGPRAGAASARALAHPDAGIDTKAVQETEVRRAAERREHEKHFTELVGLQIKRAGGDADPAVQGAVARIALDHRARVREILQRPPGVGPDGRTRAEVLEELRAAFESAVRGELRSGDAGPIVERLSLHVGFPPREEDLPPDIPADDVPPGER